ncbi:MAG: hypothetical protein Q9224_005328 [Gallowayella concinna]
MSFSKLRTLPAEQTSYAVALPVMATAPDSRPLFLREPIAPFQSIDINSYPEELQSLLSRLVTNINLTTEKATRMAVTTRADTRLGPDAKETAFLAWKHAWRAQKALKGLGAEIEEEFMGSLEEFKTYFEQQYEADTETIELLNGTIEGLAAIKEAQRPGTGNTELQLRLANTQAIQALGQARQQAQLKDTCLAIINLPVAWLQQQLDRRFLPQFRVPGPRNPSGCWFYSYGQGGGYQQRLQPGGGWAEHRNDYQQANMAAVLVPNGANPNGPWTLRGIQHVIGAQPRWHHIAAYLSAVRFTGNQTMAADMLKGIYLGRKDDPNSMEASHLCHYKGCANPDHIVIESRAMNGLRNTCQGSWQWKVQEGGQFSILNPCPHRTLTRGNNPVRECILPTATVGLGQYIRGKPQPGFLGAGEI